MLAPVLLLGMLAAFSAGAGPASDFTNAAAAQVLDPAQSAAVVLGRPAP